MSNNIVDLSQVLFESEYAGFCKWLELSSKTDEKVRTETNFNNLIKMYRETTSINNINA